MTRIEPIIEDLLLYHGRHPEDTERARERLIELAKEDAEVAARMKAVMKMWDGTRSELPIFYDALPDGLPDTEELCLVVLGYRLEKDGGMTKELVGRLSVALRSAEKYPNAYVLCTGGGTAKDRPDVTEAGQMAAWLAEKGVEKKRIIAEDRSRSTGQNALFSCDLLAKEHPAVRKIALITSDYHIVGGTVAFLAASMLGEGAFGGSPEVIANAAWRAPSGDFPPIFQAYALSEICCDRLRKRSVFPAD